MHNGEGTKCGDEFWLAYPIVVDGGKTPQFSYPAEIWIQFRQNSVMGSKCYIPEVKTSVNCFMSPIAHWAIKRNKVPEILWILDVITPL